jgi:hypothetical protein
VLEHIVSFDVMAGRNVDSNGGSTPRRASPPAGHRVADRFEGPLGESPYLGRYARSSVPLLAVVREVDGEPAIAIYAESAGPGAGPGADAGPGAGAGAGHGPAHLRAFVRLRLSMADSRIVEITDYTHCPWVMAAADHVSPIPARA